MAEAQPKSALADLAQLSQSEEDLRNATIVSPIDGVVLSRDRGVGDAVSSILTMGSGATLVMTLGDLREVYVKGKVDESSSLPQMLTPLGIRNWGSIHCDERLLAGA